MEKQVTERCDAAPSYTQFFGLCGNPFSFRADLASLFLTPQFESALKELLYGVEAREGLALLTGEARSGKTTLARALAHALGRQEIPVAVISGSGVERGGLYPRVLRSFGLPLGPQSGHPLFVLEQWLSVVSCAGKTAVLIVDDAQSLSTELLEDLRMLLNLETPREKMLQVVLVGGPELEGMLRRRELYPLKQRIALRCKTVPLTLDQTREYVQERLQAAGANAGEPLFCSEAMDEVYSCSRGLPGMVNVLCEQALVYACAEQVRPVAAHLVAAAAREAVHTVSHSSGLQNTGAAAPLKIARSTLVEVARRIVASQRTTTGEAAAPARKMETSLSAGTPPAPGAAPVPTSRSIDPASPREPLAPRAFSEPEVKITTEATAQESLEFELASPVEHAEIGAVAKSPLCAPAGPLPRAAESSATAVPRSRWSPYAQRGWPNVRQLSRVLARVSGRCLAKCTAGLSAVRQMARRRDGLNALRQSLRPRMAASRRWLKTPFDPIQALSRWSAFRRGVRALEGTEWAQIHAYLSRWLSAPFDPLAWLRASVPAFSLRESARTRFRRGSRSQRSRIRIRRPYTRQRGL